MVFNQTPIISRTDVIAEKHNEYNISNHNGKFSQQRRCDVQIPGK